MTAQAGGSTVSNAGEVERVAVLKPSPTRYERTAFGQLLTELQEKLDELTRREATLHAALEGLRRGIGRPDVSDGQRLPSAAFRPTRSPVGASHPGADG